MDTLKVEVSKDQTFYLVASNGPEVVASISAGDLAQFVNDVWHAHDWASHARQDGKNVEEVIDQFTAPGHNEVVTAKLTLFSPGRGAQADLVVDLQDIHSNISAELYMNDVDIQRFFSLLAAVPITATEWRNPKSSPPSDWKDYLWALPWIGIFLIAAAARLQSNAASKQNHEALEKRQEECDQLNHQIRDRDNTISTLSADLRITNSQNSARDQAHKLAVDEARMTTEQKWRAKYVAERGIVSFFTRLFVISASGKANEAAVPDIHDLSGSKLEQLLGDVLAHVRNRFLLIEFKREAAGFIRELEDKIKVRGPQIAMIEGDAEITKISRSCHFGAWGALITENMVEFAPYLDSWQLCRGGQIPRAMAALDEFIDGFLPSDESKACYGAPAMEFRKYARKLRESAGFSGSALNDTPMVLVIRTAANEPLVLPVKSLEVLITIVQKVELTLTEKERQREIEQLKAEREKNINRPFHGPSL